MSKSGWLCKALEHDYELCDAMQAKIKQAAAGKVFEAKQKAYRAISYKIMKVFHACSEENLDKNDLDKIGMRSKNLV